MADRVAIFNEGRLIQVGTPRDIYERPGTRFVARFVGSSNVLDPDFSAKHGGVKGWTSLRPESIHIANGAAGGHGVEGSVVSVQYQGATTRLTVDADGTPLSVTLRTGAHLPGQGDKVTLTWPPEALHALEPA